MTCAPRPEHIPDIISDRKRFEEILYTPLSDAYAALRHRRTDAALRHRVAALVGHDVPAPLRESPRTVFFRNIVSPNFEAHRFIQLTEPNTSVPPLFWEYRSDKFTSNNDLKRYLGKLYFHHGHGKTNKPIVEALNIIDFVLSDGQPLTSVKTVWGQDFATFHHELFTAHFRRHASSFFEATHWLHARGMRAKHYYQSFLSLFVRDGILFENILLNRRELPFTTSVFLPAFLEVYRATGFKPLVVPLAPTHNEEDRGWMFYPGTMQSSVQQKLMGVA